MAENISSITVSISHRYRHLWFCKAFCLAARLPTLLGINYSANTEERIANIAWHLMGPKVVVS